MINLFPVSSSKSNEFKYSSPCSGQSKNDSLNIDNHFGGNIKRNIEHNRESGSRPMAAQYSSDFSNSLNSSDSNVKMESLAKTGKMKNINEKIETGGNIEVTNQSQATGNCYPTGLETEQTDDFYFRNYSHVNEIARPATVSYTNEMMTNRALAANYDYSAVRGYENAISSGTAFDRYDMNLNNLYASPLSMQRSNITYPTYFGSFGQEDPNGQQKYFHEHAMLKTEHGIDGSTPYYPKPMYHYDPAFPLSGFSAMNLTLRSAAAAAVASNSLPIINLTAPSVTSSNLLTHNPSYYSVAQRNTNDSSTSTNSNAKLNVNTSPHSKNNDQNSDSGTTMKNNNNNNNNNSKSRSYRLHDENLPQYQKSRSPQSEPVDLCNAPIKPTSSTFNTESNSIENTQNRPFSRESTSDSNASPYVDSFKIDPMGEYFRNKPGRNIRFLSHISIPF